MKNTSREPGNTNKKEHSLKMKQLMKYAGILWIVALASVTLCRFTEKHSFINTILLSITVIAVITGTSFAMGALFIKLSPNAGND